MSEVKRYLIQKTPIGTMMKPNPEGNWVSFEDFDHVTAERDAALARVSELESDEPEWSAMQQKLGDANVDLQQNLTEAHEQVESLERQRESELRNGQELQQRLSAADERMDVLEGLLREWRHGVGPSLRDIVSLHQRTDATLKPSAEGGGNGS